METAAAAAAALRDVHGAASVPELRPEPDLVELDQGDWEGRHRDEIVARYPAELEAWRARPTEAQAPGGERVRDAGIRARRALDRAIAALGAARPGDGGEQTGTGGYPAGHGPDTPWTLLVGHDGIFKVTLLTLLGLPLDRFWTFPWGLTGITVVELVEGRAILRAHNLADHLGTLQAPDAPAAQAEVRSETEAEARERTGSL